MAHPGTWRPHFLAEVASHLPSHLSALRQLRRAEGHERDHVDRAHAGVDTGVGAHVDAFDRLAGQPHGRQADPGRRAGEGQDGAVVVGVGMAVEELDAVDGGNRGS